MARKLIVLPDDSAKPIIDAIHKAKKSLRIKMFVFSAPKLLEAVIAAKKRGVDVRIMLNPARRDGEKDNGASRKKLLAAGVTVIDSNPAFGLTHEKSMVVDDKIGFVKSLNWEVKKPDRDARLRGSGPRRSVKWRRWWRVRSGLAPEEIRRRRRCEADLVHGERA